MLAGCNDSTNYERHPDSDERIDAQLENQIRHDFASRNRVEFDDVFISFYFGTYNGASAVRISFMGEHFLPALRRLVVGGIDFGYVSFNFIVVWHEGIFHPFSTAFDQGLLSIENIERIRYYWDPFYRAVIYNINIKQKRKISYEEKKFNYNNAGIDIIVCIAFHGWGSHQTIYVEGRSELAGVVVVNHNTTIIWNWSVSTPI